MKQHASDLREEKSGYKRRVMQGTVGCWSIAPRLTHGPCHWLEEISVRGSIVAG